MAVDLSRLDERALADHISSQRWYGSKTREIAQVRVIDEVKLREHALPHCTGALVEVRFHEGTHDTYQLVLGARPADGAQAGAIGEVDGWVIYDALADPLLARELVELMRGNTTIEGGEGTLELRRIDGLDRFEHAFGEGRVVDAEQSNSSVVFGEELILKIYRRLEAGINPELELLRFLTTHDFPNIATLYGWTAYSGRPIDATLGLLQRFIANGIDGWDLALDSLTADPDSFLSRIVRLGEVTGAMHTVLASDPSDPSFAVEESSIESLGLLVASVDEEIEQVFLDLPPARDELAPIAGRGEEVREQLRLLSRVGSVGRVIRHHGDYHLGQVLWTGDDWIVIDFEGEPARSLSERRQKRSPLRDVAGMLRSFAYVASAAPLTRGVEPPLDFEERAREQFLAGYYTTVDKALLPAGEEAINRLLSVFELEKAVYELRYELENRPDWVGIPVSGIDRLLQTTSA